YRLKIDGQSIAVATKDEWAAGVRLLRGPDIDQVERLRQTIVEKNRLYFYRWRQQYETYLFGFRKQEQGQNAREIPLFDPLVAKPIQMNFDSDGRLWVATSEVYPQIKPGQKANDKIIILEDRDGDGRADNTTVFIDGLLIPTGVEPGDGGAYVANSTDLVHFADTKGTGRADHQRIVLSGFGTEDTHHIIHTLRWGPDGMLYFNQSTYIHSHIETPHGVRRLGGGGIWQFRPDTMRLEVFLHGLINA